MTSACGVVSRQDYLPFGEEASAGVGMRSTRQGYSQPDSVLPGVDFGEMVVSRLGVARRSSRLSYECQTNILRRA